MFSANILEKGYFFIRTPKRHWARFRRSVSILTLFVFLLSSVLPSYAQSVLNLPVPGTMVGPSLAFVPVLLKGMTIDPKNPLYFDFIVDSGNTKFTHDQIKEESSRLVKYFLAAMTVPQNDLWVNLSPYEKDRIVPDELGKTELGRDMLAQDYILKQLTASLIYPESDLGKKFWEKVYAKAYQKLGTTKIPADTFNKVWIVPQEATVYENGNAVYIVKSRLKVMMEEDYVALQAKQQVDSREYLVSSKNQPLNTNDQMLTTSSLSSQIVREIILPEIEKEVNDGKNFAPIRQIYQSLILAQWYKETIKESLLSKVYIDQKKIKGVDLSDSTIKDQIYARYVESFKKGVFDLIKTEYDQPSQRIIPRKYFSGGEKFGKIPLNRTQELGSSSSSPAGDDYKLSLRIEPQKDCSDMVSSSDKAMKVEHTDIAKEIKDAGAKFGKDVEENAMLVEDARKILDNLNELSDISAVREAANVLGKNTKNRLGDFDRLIELLSDGGDLEEAAIRALGDLGDIRAESYLIKNKNIRNSSLVDEALAKLSIFSKKLEALSQKLAEPRTEKGIVKPGIPVSISRVIVKQVFTMLIQRQAIDTLPWEDRLAQGVRWTMEDMKNYDHKIFMKYREDPKERAEEIARVSEEFLAFMRKEEEKGIHFFMYSGGSGIGKSVILDYIKKKYPEEFPKFVTHVSRPPRDGEEDGVHYHYLKNFKSGEEPSALGVKFFNTGIKDLFQGYHINTLDKNVQSADKTTILECFPDIVYSVEEKYRDRVRTAFAAPYFVKFLWSIENNLGLPTAEEIANLSEEDIPPLISGLTDYSRDQTVTEDKRKLALELLNQIEQTDKASLSVDHSQGLERDLAKFKEFIMINGVKIIGVTGPSGAGKSTLSLYIRREGNPVVSLDEIYTNAPEALKEQVYHEVGENLFSNDGVKFSKLTRKTKEKFQNILGPYVIEELLRQLWQLSKEGNKRIFIEGVQLRELGIEDILYHVLFVNTSHSKRIELKTRRIDEWKARGKKYPSDMTSEEYAKKAISLLEDLFSVAESSHSNDTIVNNDGAPEKLYSQGRAFLEDIRHDNISFFATPIENYAEVLVAILKSAIRERIEYLRGLKERKVRVDAEILKDLYSLDYDLSLSYEKAIQGDILDHNIIRVLQLNVFKQMDQGRLDKMEKALKDEFPFNPPHFIALQETNSPLHPVTRLAAILGYTYAELNGMAILYPQSFEKIGEVQEEIGEIDGRKTFLLGVKLRSKITGKVLNVFTTHLPARQNDAYRQARKDRLARANEVIKEFVKDEPVIFSGDFNYGDDHEIVEAAQYLPSFTDTFKEINPFVRGATTTREYRKLFVGEAQAPDRIYSLGLPPLSSKVTLDRDPVSDHLGVLTDFNWNKGGNVKPFILDSKTRTNIIPDPDISFKEQMRYWSQAVVPFGIDEQILIKAINVLAGSMDAIMNVGVNIGGIDLSKINDPWLVSTILRMIKRKILGIEGGLGILTGKEMDEKVERILSDLRSGRLKIKGEELDILMNSESEEVVGRIDRNIAEAFGYIHRTANAIVVTPDGKEMVLIRRAHNKEQYPKYLTILGGHVFAGKAYEEGVVDELLEELELDSLEGTLEEVDIYSYGFDDLTRKDMTKERRKLFVYKMSTDEYQKVLSRQDELQTIAKALNGEEGLRKELEEKQFQGVGEVLSYHIMSLDEVFNSVRASDDNSPYGETNFVKIIDTVIGKEIEVPMAPDLLAHLINEPKLRQKTRDTISKIASTPDSSMIADSDVGGIDMNDIEVKRQGSGVDIQFDPAIMQDILINGVDGFVPVIINLAPIHSIFPILGLKDPEDQPLEYNQVSSLN